MIVAALQESTINQGPPCATDVAPGVVYQPILDVARGIAAGYQAQSVATAAHALDALTGAWSDPIDIGLRTAAAVSAALATLPTLPANTFLSLPVPVDLVVDPTVRAAFTDAPALHGVVLDIVGFPTGDTDKLEATLADYRAAGARISVGGSGAAQPELTSIVRLKPAIIRLGRDWVRGIDRSEVKRSTVEVIGQLAGQLDAWILSEGVTTAAELRTLAELNVPLAQGPIIGEPQPFWPEIDQHARVVLPREIERPSAAGGFAGGDSVLRDLVQHVYTSTDAGAAAAVLPETSGFDVVVIVDQYHRPVSLLESGSNAQWQVADVLSVNIDTPVADAVSRAMARPRPTRFAPIACTDGRGRLLGIVRLEALMAHLARRS